MTGSISPLKAWWEDPDPCGRYQVTSHDEWGVVYVVSAASLSPFEQTTLSDRTLFTTGQSFQRKL